MPKSGLFRPYNWHFFHEVPVLYVRFTLYIKSRQNVQSFGRHLDFSHLCITLISERKL